MQFEGYTHCVMKDATLPEKKITVRDNLFFDIFLKFGTKIIWSGKI